jgi:hypothetical protein
MMTKSSYAHLTAYYPFWAGVADKDQAAALETSPGKEESECLRFLGQLWRPAAEHGLPVLYEYEPNLAGQGAGRASQVSGDLPCISSDRGHRIRIACG